MAAAKFVFKVQTKLDNDSDNIFDTFNVAAPDFEGAVRKAEEVIAEDKDEDDNYTEEIVSVIRLERLGRKKV